MTDIVSYVEYFRKIATDHPEINDFFMMDINEPLAALRSTIRYPALILTTFSGNFQAPNLDDILDVVQGGFLLIDHPARQDDFQSETLAMDRMKRIGTQIIKTMLTDYLACQPIAVKAIPGFDINSVSYELLGPVFDNDFGVVFSFTVMDITSF